MAFSNLKFRDISYFSRKFIAFAASIQMKLLTRNQHSPVNVRVSVCSAVYLSQTVGPALRAASRHLPVFLCEDSSASL
uniref:Ovule protein n=1 Tax=Macrostomum lignano TaxID=282301 RepID=A0A1I8HJZ5_9PLAT